MTETPFNQAKAMRNYLVAKFAKPKCAFAAHKVTEFETWKAQLRSQLAALIGLDKMAPAELRPRLVESLPEAGYRREKWVIRTEPGVWMPFYCLIPEGTTEASRMPCIIAPHGHGGAGKALVAGVLEEPLVKQAREIFHADYGRQLVKEGFVVFCPDARGAGERREWLQRDDVWGQTREFTCSDLNNAALGLGMTLAGMWVWDLKRLLDFVETLPFVDAQRVGCCGFSGGGWQTLWLAALDDRVRCALVSGYFHGFRDVILRNNLCGCNFIPHLSAYIDMGDLGALVAPKPLLIESGNADPLNGERGLENVYEQVAVTRSAYQLLGEAERIEHKVFDGKHEWNGSAASDFFQKWLE